MALVGELDVVLGLAEVRRETDGRVGTDTKRTDGDLLSRNGHAFLTVSSHPSGDLHRTLPDEAKDEQTRGSQDDPAAIGLDHAQRCGHDRVPDHGPLEARGQKLFLTDPPSCRPASSLLSRLETKSDSPAR